MRPLCKSSTVSDPMFVSILTSHKIVPEKVTLFLTPPRPFFKCSVFFSCHFSWQKRKKKNVHVSMIKTPTRNGDETRNISYPWQRNWTFAFLKLVINLARILVWFVTTTLTSLHFQGAKPKYTIQKTWSFFKWEMYDPLRWKVQMSWLILLTHFLSLVIKKNV